ncbi:hypothetical protein PspLS_05057 [Pyricularia sp. CBS 133598]|nr:hypothetical protein PspLS_05057 [Pyricularia sp. CBS 133598]
MISPASKASMIPAMAASKAMKPSKGNSIEKSPGEQDAVNAQPDTENGPDERAVTPPHQETSPLESPTLSSGDDADKARPVTPQSHPYDRELDSLDGEELPAFLPDTSDESDDHVKALAISSEPSQMPPRAATTVEDMEQSWARPGQGLSDPFVQTDKMAATLV